MPLTKSTNLMCELVKKVLHLGTEGVLHSRLRIDLVFCFCRLVWECITFLLSGHQLFALYNMHVLLPLSLCKGCKLIACPFWNQKVSLARRFALVPLGPPLLSYQSNCKAMLTAVDGAVELAVDRPYKAGDPIVVWYDTYFIWLHVIWKKRHGLAMTLFLYYELHYKIYSWSLSGVALNLTQSCL